MIKEEKRLLFSKIKLFREERIMKKMKLLMRLVGISLALLLLFTASACNTAQAEEVDLLIEKEDEKVFEETKEKSLSKMQDLAGMENKWELMHSIVKEACK